MLDTYEDERVSFKEWLPIEVGALTTQEQYGAHMGQFPDTVLHARQKSIRGQTEIELRGHSLPIF